MFVYMRARAQVSSIILTSFRQGGSNSISPLPPPSPQNKPLKSLSRFGLTCSEIWHGPKTNFGTTIKSNKITKVISLQKGSLTKSDSAIRGHPRLKPANNQQKVKMYQY